MLAKQALAPSTPAPRIALQPYLALAKLRIVGLLVFVSLVAAMVAGGGSAELGPLALLALAGTLSSAGSATLNHYLERDLDALMVRTRSRPLPSGDLRPERALALGLALIGGALVAAVPLGIGSVVAMLAGVFCYVVVYTLVLKRCSSWNVPIGGIAGSCAILTGWLAVDPNVVSAAPLLMATMLFFWNQSHFWAFAIARREDYSRARIPMLPVVVGARPAARAIAVNTAALVFASLAMWWLVPMHWVYLAGACLAGMAFLWQNVRLVRNPSPAIAWTNFKFSGVYLLLLFLSMSLDALVRL